MVGSTFCTKTFFFLIFLFSGKFYSRSWKKIFLPLRFSRVSTSNWANFIIFHSEMCENFYWRKKELMADKTKFAELFLKQRFPTRNTNVLVYLNSLFCSAMIIAHKKEKSKREKRFSTLLTYLMEMIAFLLFLSQCAVMCFWKKIKIFWWYHSL